MNRLARSSSISDGIFDFSGNLMLDAFVVVALDVAKLAEIVADVAAASSEEVLPYEELVDVDEWVDDMDELRRCFCALNCCCCSC